MCVLFGWSCGIDGEMSGNKNAPQSHHRRRCTGAGLHQWTMTIGVARLQERTIVGGWRNGVHLAASLAHLGMRGGPAMDHLLGGGGRPHARGGVVQGVVATVARLQGTLTEGIVQGLGKAMRTEQTFASHEMDGDGVFFALARSGPNVSHPCSFAALRLSVICLVYRSVVPGNRKCDDKKRI